VKLFKHNCTGHIKSQETQTCANSINDSHYVVSVNRISNFHSYKENKIISHRYI